MNFIKKNLVLLIVAFLIISPNISAFADTGLNNSQTNTELNNSQILFGQLFFTKNEDINKITNFISTNHPGYTYEYSDDEIDIFDLIDNLQLNTDYQETVCILENITIIIDEIKKDGVLNSINIININNDYSIQPLWGATVHRDKTEAVASKYFSKDIAKKIGAYNREVDIKYSSVIGAVFNKQNQYIHFNQYASGSEDSRDYAASTWFVASNLAWNNNQKENAYMYLGYALHPLQDKESHGQIGRGQDIPRHDKEYIKGDNITHADDETGWEWTDSNKNKLKYVSGSRVRYNAAVSVTDTWLKKYKDILK